MLGRIDKALGKNKGELVSLFSHHILKEYMSRALSEFDFIVAIDTSGSMGEAVKSGSNQTRWEAVQETAMTVIREVEKIDEDGLGLVLFGGANVESFDGVTSDKFREIFKTRSPRGSTPLAEALTAAIKLTGKSDKKDFVIVLTDGEPNSRADAIKVICDQAKSQGKDEDLTFLFIQVGDDAGATDFLKMLDDGLQDKYNLPFDIVDVKTVAEVDQFNSSAELILAAIQG